MVLHSKGAITHPNSSKPYGSYSTCRKFILSKIDDPRQFDADLQQLIFGTGGLVQACHMGFEHLSSMMGPMGLGFGELGSIMLNPLVLKSICGITWARLCLGITGGE